ncbi:MAG: HAD family hydrolase [Anaerolineae bacterium]|nr:HAD family hydrolase [Anaerolineae bacterium]
MMPALILFDIDGTLLRTRGAGREATRRALLEVFGTEAGVAAHHFSGKTDWQTLVELLSGEGYTDQRIGVMMPLYDASVGRHTAAVIPQYEIAACEGALTAVESLRRRDDLLLGIVTGNARSAAPHKLRAAGFDPEWFAVGAYGSEALDRNHLTPLALERARMLLGGEPAAVIVVGDTPMDIACARAIQAVAVAVECGFAPREELLAHNPDYLIPHLGEFAGVLDAVITRS